MIDYNLLGERVTALRKKKGLTQSKLAERAEISNNYVSNIENHHSIPSLETLLKICDALETTPNDLILNINTESVNYSNSDILELLNQCSPIEKRYIKSFIKVFLSERKSKAV
jgi:transcriptional regulator with XRE-family HTH domain